MFFYASCKELYSITFILTFSPTLEQSNFSEKGERLAEAIHLNTSYIDIH